MEEETKVTDVQETENVEVEPEVNASEELAKLKLEYAKVKKAMDKASSDAASLKKQLREKQTAEEIALQEKAEADAKREEEYQALVKKVKVSELEKGFLELGYSKELAEKSAIAQFDGDTSTLFAIQKEFIDNMNKELKANLLATQPVPPISNNKGVSITKDQFNKMSYDKRVELFEKNRELYDSLVKA